METVFFGFLLVIGIALLLGAGLLSKKKSIREPREQKIARVYKDYDKMMDSFRK